MRVVILIITLICDNISIIKNSKCVEEESVWVKKKRNVIASIIILLIMILLVIPFCVSIYLYNEYFGIRYETYEPLSYNLEDFPNLKRNKYEFNSNKGQKLVGYNYYTNDNAKGIIIISHGFGGGGHNSYMDCANYFAKNGYYVFAFDNTGNDESEGKAVNGLPQGVIDLDYAISFIEKQKEFENLPIMLFGHSWGGYSVTNVLNYHPEIKSVVSLAGFNKSSDLLRSQGEQLIGKIVNILMPYINIYEKIKFGDYASNTSMSGFEKTNTKIMIVHSEDDNVVQKKYGYDIYNEKYNNSSRFTFISYKNKGHNQLYYSDSAIKYINKFNDGFKEYFGGLEITAEKKQQYINENLDRTVWGNLLDEELFTKIIEFYDSSL